MGNVVSLVDIQHHNPASEDPVPPDPISVVPQRPLAPARITTPPSRIHLTYPQVLGAFALPLIISPSPGENPLDSPPLSPTLSFHTAPSTPVTSPQGEDPPPDPPPVPIFGNSTPPSPPRINLPSIASVEIETIPSPEVLSSPDFALDFTLDDEGLSTLEKIYLFSRSRSAHHRYALRSSDHQKLLRSNYRAQGIYFTCSTSIPSAGIAYRSCRVCSTTAPEFVCR